MAGKSRRQRRKQGIQGQKRKDRPSGAGLSAQPSVMASAGEVIHHPKVAVPAVSAPVATAKPAAILYPYIAKELLTIGILAGIMVVILIVLALVLPS